MTELPNCDRICHREKKERKIFYDWFIRPVRNVRSFERALSQTFWIVIVVYPRQTQLLTALIYLCQSVWRMLIYWNWRRFFYNYALITSKTPTISIHAASPMIKSFLPCAQMIFTMKKLHILIYLRKNVLIRLLEKHANLTGWITVFHCIH